MTASHETVQKMTVFSLRSRSAARILAWLMVCVLHVFAGIGTDSGYAGDTESLVKKGNALFENGDYDGALRAYEEAAVFDPESPRILFNKGTALFKKQNFTAAREAFQKAALKSRDTNLEARARYNAGLCFFQEGERQKDSDLQKTIDAYTSSIQLFQEALKLNPEFTRAAENLEMVRLMMKSVLDEIKKQEEAAQKQQAAARKTAEKIKNLIDRQQALLDTSRAGMETPPPSAADQRAKNQELADQQNQLKQDTTTFSEELAASAGTTANPAAGNAPGPGSPPAIHPANPHLDASANAQDKAVGKLTDNNLPEAANHQETSLDALEKALEALSQQQSQNQGQNQQAEKQQTGEQQTAPEKPDDAANDPENNPANETDKNAGTEDREKDEAADNSDPSDAARAFELTDDPESIIEEERKNKQQRMPVSSGAFKDVDKNW